MQYKFSIFIVLAFLVSSCGSNKVLGVRDFSVKNIERIELDDQAFEITFEVNALDHNTQLEYLYFDNQKSTVVNYSENKFSAKFAPSKINSEDRILSVNRAEEAKNTLPQLPVKPPLEIEKSEALLSYVVESEIKYKVLDLKSEL